MPLSAKFHQSDYNKHALSPNSLTIGDRIFPVVTSKLWNALPQNVTSASP